VLNRDESFLGLKHAQIIPQTSCFMAQSGSETSSSSEYSESLAADASVGAEGEAFGVSGSFSASAGMR